VVSDAVPAISQDRFNRTVQRIGAEAYWLHIYQTAINGMRGVDAIGLDFFRVSLNALKDARLIRLIRVLEDDSQTASFWYLLRTNQPLIKKAAKASHLDLIDLLDIAERMRGIRDKTFVHIDKTGVFDPQQYYTAAGLNNDKVAEIIDALWSTMQAVHLEVFGEPVEPDIYSGKDIKQLAALRDASA
jgi:hypothetical protein